MEEFVIKTELTVHSILNKRISAEGKVEYNVLWEDCSNDTWETEENLNCSGLLKSFNDKWKDLTDEEVTSVIPITICKTEPELIIECDDDPRDDPRDDLYPSNPIIASNACKLCGKTCASKSSYSKHFRACSRRVSINTNITANTFLKLGSRYTKKKTKECETTRKRNFKAFFGVTPHVCSIAWEKIKLEAPPDSEPKHLLWCLMFLKQYPNEHIRSSLLRADEKTLRKWTWIFIALLSNLNVINWDKRHDGAVNGETCFCSLDTVDFKIIERQKSSKKWYSKKLRGPGLRYEIGLNIHTGCIVWTNGGYPCGEYTDMTLALESFVPSLKNDERAMADKNYRDEKFFIPPNDINRTEHKLIMSRHEKLHNRIRNFQILKKPFRHDREKHPMIFKSVVNLTELLIEHGEPLI